MWRQTCHRESSQAHSTPLPDGFPIGNTYEYRAAFLHAVVRANPDQSRSRKQIAALLGIRESAITPTMQRAGVTNTPQFEEHPVTGEQEVKQLIRTRSGYPLRIVRQRLDGETIECRFEMEEVRAFAQEQAAIGGSLSVRFQTASRQQIATETPPKVVKRPAPRSGRTKPVSTEAPARESRPRYYGPGYDPVWLRGQLLLALRLLGWERDGRLVNPTTGEIIPAEASARVLLEALLGRQIAFEDAVLAAAQRLGAITTRREWGECFGGQTS